MSPPFIIGLTAISARPFAGGWNDGSGLATLESLADRHSLHIEHFESGLLAHSGLREQSVQRGDMAFRLR